jgi:hypothetical protein
LLAKTVQASAQQIVLFLTLSGILALGHRITAPLGAATAVGAFLNAFLYASVIGTIYAGGLCRPSYENHMSAQQNYNGKSREKTACHKISSRKWPG